MTFIHYGWPASPYSAKSRAALRVSGLDWTEARPHVLTFAWLEAHVGRKVIPVLRTPEGEFVQDSSRIVDLVEGRSGRAMTPVDPVARTLALWLEVFADEWLIYPAMDFRWRYRGGDVEFMIADFGRCAAPGAPAMVRAKAGETIANAMRRYLPIMGIDARTGPAMARTTFGFLDRLAAHLERSPYLLGDHPCIADFAVYGPIAAHIGRDPWSAHVIDDRPAIRRWVSAIDRGRDLPGTLALDPDALPPTLVAVLESALTIAAPAWIEAHRLAIQRWRAGPPLRRRLGEFEARLDGGVVHPHKLTAVNAWKLQRPLRAQAALAPAVRRGLLATLGCEALAELDPSALAGYDLDAIAWKRDPTSFGLLGRIVETLTPLVRHVPPVRPVHPKRAGPVRGLGQFE